MNPPSKSADMESFRQQVTSITEQLETVWTGGDEWKSRRFGALAIDDKNAAVEEVLNQVYQDATAKAESSLGPKDEIRAAALEARSALLTPSIMSAICRALRPIAGKSSGEVAAELTKGQLPLALTGQGALSASPLIFGLVAFTVARVGAALLCAEQS